MKNQRAKISVIIPVYNRAGLIGETLRSLLNQTVPAKEIIVVDDGSTDDTARVVERIAEEIEVRRAEIGKERGAGSREQGGETALRSIVDSELLIADCAGGAKALDAGPSTLDSPPAMKPQLRLIRQANAGPGAARNRGLREATGEFIHFFDSDDIAAQNKHEVQLRALLETGADIAYGPWVKGRFVNLTTEDTENTEEKAVLRLGNPSSAAFSNPSTSELARPSENPSLICSADGPAEGLDAGRWTLDAGPWNFVPEGPVLQARGLPKGDLVRALLTNWSIVPHACLFRKSILERAGGFPEDIWVGEDQLLFLRCLLAGARVVHTPGTMVFYRVGNDAGKLTAAGAAQERHARDWGRFLLKANQEVTSGGWRVTRKRKCLTTEDTEGTEGAQGDAQLTRAGASEPDSLTSKLADSPVSESPTRSASGPALAAEPPRPDCEGLISDSAGGAKALDAGPSTLDAFPTPSAWFGFRLRAYEAWRDLEKFFPDGEGEVKLALQEIWRRNRFSVFRVQFSGFLIRKLGGVKLRLFGYREHASFRCGRPSRRADRKIEVRPS